MLNAPMLIRAEPVGSIPQPPELVRAFAERRAGRISATEFDRVAEAALRDTLHGFANAGSTVISDGEQMKSRFVTYPLEGLDRVVPDWVVIRFADGHTRQLADTRKCLDSRADNVQIDFYIQLASEKDPTRSSPPRSPTAPARTFAVSSASRIRSARKPIRQNRYGTGCSCRPARPLGAARNDRRLRLHTIHG
jgi:hypothetical protein